ncbi:hypothetical protein B0H12DRAFT_1107205 [Mycena haematopus]|nr:hypothetical protein B0H12DRAFT_1107205 [Mycena haematopus]
MILFTAPAACVNGELVVYAETAEDASQSPHQVIEKAGLASERSSSGLSHLDTKCSSCRPRLPCVSDPTTFRPYPRFDAESLRLCHRTLSDCARPNCCVHTEFRRRSRIHLLVFFAETFLFRRRTEFEQFSWPRFAPTTHESPDWPAHATR